MSERHARRLRRRSDTAAARRLALRRATTPMVLGVLALAAIVGPGMTSQAALTAEQALTGFQISGAAVRQPTGPLALASIDGPLGVPLEAQTFPVTGSWDVPARGVAPDSYRVFRKLAGSPDWGAEPVATPQTTTFRDDTAAHCATYDYRVVSAFKRLRSPGGIRARIVNDHLAPTVARSYIEAAPTGVAALGGYLRPGSPYYVYAQINDDCGLADGTLTADLSALGGNAATPLETLDGGAGRWERDGASYNFRAGPFTAAALADGAAPAWHIDADDGRGHPMRATGAPAIVDGTAPTAPNLQAVPSPANTYTGADSKIRANGDFSIYAEITDPGSGLAGTPILDASALTTPGTGLSLVSGSYQAGPVSTWTHRSTVLRSLATLPQGATPTFTVIVRDRLGNERTVTGTAHVDNTGGRLTSCSMTSADAIWNAGDTTTLTFSDPVLPSSAVAGWTGAAPVGIGASMVHDGPGDSFVYPGTNLLAGAGTGGHWLGSKAWVNGQSVSYAGTTLSVVGPTTWQITYGAGSRAVPTGNDQPSGLTFNPSTLLTDQLGNPLTAGSVSCSFAAAPPAAPLVQEQTLGADVPVEEAPAEQDPDAQDLTTETPVEGEPAPPVA